MSFGGRGSSYQHQEGTTARDVPRRLEMPYDQLVRGLIGQMAKPPETAISVPLQQAVSNLQGGDPGLNFTPSGSMASRLGPSASGTGGGGYDPASLLPDAPGGQKGLQTREQLGLPNREDYFTFMPKPEDIEKIGLAPVRTQIKGKDKTTKQIGRLEDRIATRDAAGKGHAKADRRLAKAQDRLARNTGESYR